ncbi:MAG: ABC transporter ATP-binding protein, partial [Spirulina sp. DLM2.Bin59]
GALLLITHDRYFLDRVTTRILEIDRGDLYNYNGNYAYYLEKKADAEASAASSERKHAGVLRRELAWLRQGPKARSTKQQARIDRIDTMREKTFKTAQEKVSIDTPGRRIGKKVIELVGVSKAYGDRPLIADFSYEFGPSDRIGIIGGNGAGKSTLMNMITGRIEPDQGRVEIGSTIHFGYFDQHSEDLLAAKDQNQRVIDYIKARAELVKTADGSIITASQMLERFLFPPSQQYAPIHKLSGGEKRRLFLLEILMGAPNVLILDEPTNDLDVQTLAVLEDYLENFNGCVLCVSHDRYFLDRTVDFIFALEPGGKLRQYPGNYSVYLDDKKAALATAKAAKIETPKPPASPPTPKTPTPRRRLSNYQRRELAELETKIPTLEAQKAALERTIYQNPPTDYTKLQALTDELAQLTTTIDEVTERWLTLAELEESN